MKAISCIIRLIAAFLWTFALVVDLRGETDLLSLDGTWRFELDPQDAGITGHWFEKSLAKKLTIPGALQNQGFGDEISINTPWVAQVQNPKWFEQPEYAKFIHPGNFRMPFWLQPEKYYAGAAWYQRDIVIPKSWSGERIALTLERPHIETHVWLDETDFGSRNSLSTPHEYALGTNLGAGKHRLTIRVDNRRPVDVGINSHSVSDHTQGNWNGVVGDISLRATPLVWIEDVQAFPDVAKKAARVRLILGNGGGRRAEGKISLFVEAKKNSSALHVPPVSTNFNTDETNVTVELEMNLGERAKLWDEFSPALYRLRAEIRGEAGGKIFEHKRLVTFGLREIGTKGTQFTINGRKTFFRGTLDCCIFPLTGYPPTDVASWKRVIGAAKAHGLNLIRFHSWCPPEAAFEAADELGFYFQVECSSWANQSTTLGDGAPVDAWLYAEGERILRAYGNHPSFALFLYGNEPGGKNHREYLAKWVAHFKNIAPRQLVSSGSGWPQLPENQFHVTPDPRIQGWGQGLHSRINARPPETTTDYRDYIQKRSVPVISHEIGQWCVYPNFDEIPKYKGPLKPKNFEIFRESLNANHMGDQAHDFLIASGKLQTLCYKEDIESALRTAGMGGFELLDLHDFPGQGTALVGVLDPFWESKGYVTAKEYSRFCNSTVPLARMNKRVFTTDESFEADVQVAHFGPAVLPKVKASWKLVDEKGRIASAGELPARDIPIDNSVSLGTAKVSLKEFSSPAKYRFVVNLDERFENDWDVWIYPATLPAAPVDEIKIVRSLDEEAREALERGGKVLLLISDRQAAAQNKVALGFSSIFWNTAWTRGQAPHTLGILCDPKHPVFAEFPTDFCSNWQWWYVINQSHAMILNDLPPDVRPLVQVIDDWVTNRRLGLLFEARVGRGKLVVSGIDLEANLDTNPVVRQMRHSVLRHMQSAAFQPSTEISPEKIMDLITAAAGTGS